MRVLLFSVGYSEGLGFRIGAGRFLCLAVSGETLLLCSVVVPQERACVRGLREDYRPRRVISLCRGLSIDCSPLPPPRCRGRC